jgi:hypothetical protein
MRKLNPFKPTDIAGCTLWLDGADPAGTGVAPAAGSTITTWVDKSTSANTATAYGTVTVNTLVNGKLAMSTTASSGFFGYLTNSTTTATTFVVATYVNANAYNRLFAVSSGTLTEYNNPGVALFACAINGPSMGPFYNSQNVTPVTSGPITQNQPFIMTTLFTGTQCTVNLNGKPTATSPVNISTSFSYTYYGIGTHANGFGSVGECWNGIIAEVIHYQAALSVKNYQQVEGYLAQKWGLQGSLPAGSPGRTEVIYPRNLLIDSLTTGQPTRLPFIRALRPVALGGSFQFTTTPSQYLSIPNSTAFTQNTAFTYELWYYPTSTNSGYLVAMLQSNWITVKWNTGTAGTIGLDMSFVGNPPGYVAQNRTYAINRWHHIALSWNGTNGVLYMNGVSEAVFTGAGGLVNDGNDLRIGQYQGQGQQTPLGYFTNIRFVKGVSVYTGAFTPPTAPLSVTQSAGTNISAITAGQTQLLISATTSGSLLTDSSTNNFTITNNGSVAWNALTPFS